MRPRPATGIPLVLAASAALLLVGATPSPRPATPASAATGAVASAASAAASADPVIAAAGDIACDPSDPSYNRGLGTSTQCRQKAVSDLLVNAGLSAVLPLGDNQYESGRLPAYQASYGPSWGRVLAITHPVPGNHEYGSGGSGYYSYFGARAGRSSQGYYSYDIGRWHVIALNSECSYVGCATGSAQERWLAADLAAHPNSCTLAYWHQPRFSSGKHGGSSAYDAFWRDLYAARADVVLNGHDHDYERFALQTPTGAADPTNGLREFVVGTGGRSHYGFGHVVANSQARNSDTFGVLKLTLHPTSYEWRFVPEAGRTFQDSGANVCHNASGGTTLTLAGPATVSRGSVVYLTGTTAPNAQVYIYFHRQNFAGYTLRRVLTASAGGQYSTSYVADVDYRYYAASAGQGAGGLTQARGTTIAGPATVPRGTTVTLSGLAYPGSSAYVYFHKRDTTGYTLRRILPVDAYGRYSTTYVAVDDYRYYAVAAGYGSPAGLTQVTG